MLLPWVSQHRKRQEVHSLAKKRGRGQYDRSDTVGKRVKWLEHVQEYMCGVKSGTLMGRNQCSRTCHKQSCNEFIDMRVAKLCAEESFGSAVLTEDWSKIRSNHQTVKHWFTLVHAFRVLDPLLKTVTHIHYKINGMSVCGGAWAAFHGVRPATAAAIHRHVMQNHNHWTTGLGKQALSAIRSERAHLSNAAAAWWYERLGYYEMIVDHRHIILYPRDICWTAVYEEEFIPEMHKLELHWKKPTVVNSKVKRKSFHHTNKAPHEPSTDDLCGVDDDSDHDDDCEVGEEQEDDGDIADGGKRGSISTWYLGRTIALQRFAHDKLGEDAKPFKLKSRAKHSAYVSDLCMPQNT